MYTKISFSIYMSYKETHIWYKQFFHLAFKCQETTEEDLKAWMTNWESYFIHILVYPLSTTTSIAFIAACNSATKASLGPINWAKQPLHTPLWSLKIPHAATLSGFLTAAPLVLTFIKFWIGGVHMTNSLIIGTLEGWIFTLQALNIVNSYIVAADVFFVLLPQRDTLEIMM